MKQRLNVLKSGEMKPVTQEERVAKEKGLAKWKGAKLRRKRAFQDLEAMLLEAGVMSREELWVSSMQQRDFMRYSCYVGSWRDVSSAMIMQVIRNETQRKPKTACFSQDREFEIVC
jgi:hypothetical protein